MILRQVATMEIDHPHDKEKRRLEILVRHNRDVRLCMFSIFITGASRGVEIWLPCDNGMFWIGKSRLWVRLFPAIVKASAVVAGSELPIICKTSINLS